MVIKKYTIFGERNSGTKYLYFILNNILYIDFTQEYGFKHWYIKDLSPRGINNTTTDNECIKSINDSDDTLFIVIVRNVYDWVGSMYKNPYYIINNSKSIYEFVSNKYVCGSNYKSNILWDESNNNNKYPYFIEEAKNLIELRNLKNNHFYNLRTKVKNFYLIRQEYLEENIYNMIKKFNLKYKILHLINYKKPTKYYLDEKTIKFIDDNIDNHLDGTNKHKTNTNKNKTKIKQK